SLPTSLTCSKKASAFATSIIPSSRRRARCSTVTSNIATGRGMRMNSGGCSPVAGLRPGRARCSVRKISVCFAPSRRRTNVTAGWWRNISPIFHPGLKSDTSKEGDVMIVRPVVKDLTILAVTKMHGGVCTAGIDGTSHWVRPVRAAVARPWNHDAITDHCLLPVDFFHGGQSHLLNLGVTRFWLTKHDPEPPHTEDWVIDTRRKPQLLRRLSEEEQEKVLAAYARTDLELLQPNGHHSLGLFLPESFSFTFSQNKTGDDVTVRASFAVAGQQVHDIGCTDLRMRALGRRLLEKSRRSEYAQRRGFPAARQAGDLSGGRALAPLPRPALGDSGRRAFDPGDRGRRWLRKTLMDDLEQALHKYFGFEKFRPGQREVIEHVLARRHTLAVLPTGRGKSLCYQLTAQMLPGVTLVVSPLIALMQDKVDALRRRAFYNVTSLSSTLTPAEIGTRYSEIERGEYKLVYVAPERCASPRFQQLVRQAAVDLFVIDEAHCISQWGHDFRPHYRTLLKRLPELRRATFLAVSATATTDVQNDIIASLALPQMERVIADFNRPNLYFETVRADKREEKDARLLELLARDEGGSAIVYASTRKEAVYVYQLLEGRGFDVCLYHAGLGAEERVQAQRDFQQGNHRVIVATVAFGMGIDKPDVRRVIHYNIPGSL